MSKKYKVHRHNHSIEAREYPTQRRTIRFVRGQKAYDFNLHFPSILFCRVRNERSYDLLGNEANSHYYYTWQFVHEGRVCLPFVTRPTDQLQVLKYKYEYFSAKGSVDNWQYWLWFPNISDLDVGQICLGHPNGFESFDEFVSYFWQSEFNDAADDLHVSALDGLRLGQKAKSHVFETLQKSQWPEMQPLKDYLDLVVSYYEPTTGIS